MKAGRKTSNVANWQRETSLGYGVAKMRYRKQIGVKMGARLGVLVPSNDNTQEPELYKVKPSNVSIHISRLWFPESNRKESFVHLLDNVEVEALKLSHSKADIISVGCTSGSFLWGAEFEQELIAKIARATGTPAITVSGAAVDALRHLVANRILLITPYPDWINTAGRQFFSSYGFDCVGVGSISAGSSARFSSFGLSTIVEVLKRERRVLKRADAVFVSCTGLKVLDGIADLEKLLGKPVVSSNQANMWKMLDMVGIRKAIPGYGRLLSQ